MMVNLDEPVRYHTLDIPVVNGFATLPDGRVVAAEEDFVRVHFLTPEAQKQLRAALVEPDSLDAAWAEAEAALPEDGYLSLSGPNNEHHYNVTAYSGHTEHVEPGDDHLWFTVNSGAIDVALPIGRGYGDTPSAALRALAAKLREVA